MWTTEALLMMMTMLRRRHSVVEWMFDGRDYGTLFLRRTWLVFDVEIVSSRGNWRLLSSGAYDDVWRPWPWATLTV